MAGTLFAQFEDYKMAEKAVGALLDHGMRQDDIGLITHGQEKDHLKHEGHAKHGVTTTTGADAGAGAVKGAGAGLVVGAVAALASLMIPGFGLVTGGSALVTALGAAAGTTAAGALTGGVTGYLKDQGVDEPAARSYEDAIKNGGALVTLTLPSEKVSRIDAENILAKYGVGKIEIGMRTAL